MMGHSSGLGPRLRRASPADIAQIESKMRSAVRNAYVRRAKLLALGLLWAHDDAPDPGFAGVFRHGGSSRCDRGGCPDPHRRFAAGGGEGGGAERMDTSRSTG